MDEQEKVLINKVETKPKIRLWLLVTLIVVIVAGGGYLAWAKYGDTIQVKLGLKEAATTSVTTATTSTTTDTTATAPAATAPTADWKTYSNDTYGFSLNLTDAWQGYSTYEKTPSDGNASKYIYFLLPTTDASFGDISDQYYGKKGVTSPFAVGVYTKSNWTREVADAGNAAFLMGQNSTYYFTFTAWQDSPSDFIGKDLGLNSIKASFKAISISPTAGWKTYNDTVNGFSLKYPTDFTKSADKGAKVGVISWVEFAKSSQFGTATIVTQVSTNSYKDISEWVTAMNQSDLGAIYTASDVSLGGVAGKKLSTDDEGGQIVAKVIKNNKQYSISLIGASNLSNKTDLNTIFEEVISSFKFN